MSTLAAGPPRIAVTVGDPLGIGPEVALRAVRAFLERPGRQAVPVLLGPPEPFARAAELLGWGRWEDEVERVTPPPAGDAPFESLPEVAAIAAAVRGALGGAYEAVVTAPISKAPLLAAGFPHPGHTEYLAALCGCSGREVMAFVGGRLRVCLLTTHLPLSRVPEAIRRHPDPAGVMATLAAALREGFGVPSPRIALCGLNPHAGEGGHLGTEDDEVLAPAVREARTRGVDARGPLPADSVFARAVSGEFDGVVACYHDQGLVAVKTLDPGGATNVTLGLPVVRTSPDHGSARDIAGLGIARGAPMEAALRLAISLAARLRSR